MWGGGLESFLGEGEGLGGLGVPSSSASLSGEVVPELYVAVSRLFKLELLWLEACSLTKNLMSPTLHHLARRSCSPIIIFQRAS